MDFFQDHAKIKRMRRKPKPGFLVPSINHYYGHRGVYIPKQKKVMVTKFLLPESIAYLDFIAMLYKKQGGRFKSTQELQLFVKACYSDNRRRDVDNPKAIMDALKDIIEKGETIEKRLFEDDSQVFDLHYRKYLQCDDDEVLIQIKEL